MRAVSFVRSQGQDVMALNAKRETGTNVIQVMDNLQARIDAVNAEVLGPRGDELGTSCEQLGAGMRGTWGTTWGL